MFLHTKILKFKNNIFLKHLKITLYNYIIMVRSEIDSTIEYVESNRVENSDQDYESLVYRGRIYGKDIKFALGRAKFDYVKKNVVYFYIYLANLDKIISKIGVYETRNTIYRKQLDEQGYVIIEKLDGPLFFHFTRELIMNNYDLIDLQDKNAKFVDKSKFKKEYTDDEDSDFDPNDDVNQDYKIIDPKQLLIQPQTKEQSDLEIANYKEKPDDNWFNKFIKSNKYSIIDNEGGGDCFFAVVRDGLKSRDIEKYKDLTVKKLRQDLANEVNEHQLKTYIGFHSFYKNTTHDMKEHSKELKLQHETLKKKIKQTDDPILKDKLIEEAKKNVEFMVKNNETIKNIASLNAELDFMKNVKTLDDLRNIIQSTTYWADTWAITTLERIYNIKFIVFAKDIYEKGEYDNVLQCGEASQEMSDKEFFQPDYYIIADYLTNVHYRLITYDKNINLGAFKFVELPYRIKELVLNKCLEKMSGPFSYIPEFRKLAFDNHIPINEYKSDIEKLIEENKQNNKPPDEQFYDKRIIIQVFNRAADKPIANGKKNENVNGEYFDKEMIKQFSTDKLYKIKDWRKKLDNFWIMSDDEKLEINNLSWSSVQHYLYATRFINIPDVFNKFSKNSEHDAANSLEEAKKLYDKLLKSYKSKIISDEEYASKESNYLIQALQSKFNDNEEFKKILLLTYPAKINIFKPGKGGGAIEFTELMKIRKLLVN